MATDLEVGQPQRVTEIHPPVKNKIHRKFIALSNREQKELLRKRVPASGKQGTRGKGRLKGREKGREKRLIKNIFGLLGKGLLVQRLLNVFAHYCAHIQKQGKNTDTNKQTMHLVHFIHFEARSSFIFCLFKNI